MPLAPSSKRLDIDYELLECAASPASVRALKSAVLGARRSKLAGVAAEDLLVYHRGASEPTEEAEVAFIAAPCDRLLASSELRVVIKESPRAFFLVMPRRRRRGPWRRCRDCRQPRWCVQSIGEREHGSCQLSLTPPPPQASA